MRAQREHGSTKDSIDVNAEMSFTVTGVLAANKGRVENSALRGIKDIIRYMIVTQCQHAGAVCAL